jgi:ubiquinone/menaquinone biosynthesis C-methylase UbiE
MANDYYDGIADGYNELYGTEQQEKIAFIKTHLPSSWKPIRLLDIGCGTGISTAAFEAKETVGIDPSSRLLEIARKTYPSISFFEGVAESLPFKDHTFDTIISLTAAQNFSDPKQALSEMARVGGNHYIITFLKTSAIADTLREKVKTRWPSAHIIEHKKDIIVIIE